MSVCRMSRLVVVHLCPAVPTQEKTAALIAMSRSASFVTEILTCAYKILKYFKSANALLCSYNYQSTRYCHLIPRAIFQISLAP